MTDKSGAVIWTAKYEPFGKAMVSKAPSVYTPNPPDLNLRFAGQYFDSETGLHYNYYRDYDPAIGRYVQSDPIGLKGGGNPYVYAYDNPLRYVDPDGLTAVLPYPVIAAACAANPAICALTGSAALFCLLHQDLCREAVDRCLPDSSPSSPMYNEPGDDPSPTDPTVGDVLKDKSGSIKNAPLPKDSPSFDDVRDTPMSEIEKGAKEGKPGYKQIKKLLKDKRFNK